MNNFLIKTWERSTAGSIRIISSNMARKNYLVWTYFVLCILIGLFDLRIDGKDSSIKLGTCVNEENEDGFCDSNDENKYLENNENLHAEETKGSTLLGQEEITTFIENSVNVNISESEVNKSLSGSEDKQTDNADNSTNDLLGLLIPVVDGVKVSTKSAFYVTISSRRKFCYPSS